MNETTPSSLGKPAEHWRRIRTNNPLERILRDRACPADSAPTRRKVFP